MAGLGELLGWNDNPLYEAFRGNRNALLGGLSGAAQRPGDPWGGATQGIAKGAALDDAYAVQQEAEAKRQEQLNQTAAYLRQQGANQLADAVDAGMINGQDAFRTWYDAQHAAPDYTANQRDFMFAQQNGYQGSFADWVNSGGTGSQVGTTIYTGRDAQGNIVPMQVGQGGFVRSPLPDGVSFDPGALNAERAYGNQVGSGRGKAEVAAPESIANAQRTLTQIQQLKDDPGLWWSVGGLGWTPNAPGNPQAGTISRIEQLQGAAFLDAFESLRGGGQITEVEGAKATNAIARLQRSQSYEDFRKALTDLEDVIQIGLDRAIRQSEGGNPVPAMGGAGNSGGWTVIGVE